MKHTSFIYFLGVVLITLITGCTSVPTKEIQARWKVVVPQQLFAEKLRIAAFYNENIGFNGGAGDLGKARFTSDGGKSWVQAESSGG